LNYFKHLIKIRLIALIADAFEYDSIDSAVPFSIYGDQDERFLFHFKICL